MDWQLRPASDLLAGDVGTLPLAVLGQLPAGVEQEVGLANVIAHLIARVEHEGAPENSRRLLTAAFVLTGMRVSRQVAINLFRGVRVMQDSDTYLYIQDEGAIKELKKMILRLGSKMLGVPDEGTKATLNGLDDLERLESLHERLADVETWQDLLANT